MIEEKQILEFVAEHDSWVSRNQSGWRAIQKAYQDKFWEGALQGEAGDGTARNERKAMSEYPFRMQVNHLRTWVYSYVDALFHQGLVSSVQMPTMPRGNLEEVTSRMGGEVSSIGEVRPSSRMATLTDLWLRESDIENQTERAFVMGLCYPEFAIKVGTYGSGNKHPVKDIWLDVLPPWEAMWDRRARSTRQMRFIGHLYWCPVEEAAERFDLNESDLEGQIAPDVLDESRSTVAIRSQDIADASYVRILEFYDMTTEWKAKDGTETDGEYRAYIVEGFKDGKRKTEPVFKGPVPYANTDGGALPPIIPANFISVPEYPLMGVSPAVGQYNINYELNMVHTFMVNAARRDAARQLLVQGGVFDQDGLARLTSGADMELIETEDENANLGQVAMWLDQQPVSSTLLEVYKMLEAARDKTSLTTPLARGESVKYATAAEIHSLNAFTETTLGRIARRMNDLMVNVVELFYRVLAAHMDDNELETIPLWSDEKLVNIQRPWLDEDWQVTIVDTGSTPLGEAEKKRSLGEVAPQLMELYALAKQGDAMAKALMDYTIELYNLPKEFKFDTLIQEEPPPPPPPPEAAPPGGPPGMPPGMPMPMPGGGGLPGAVGPEMPPGAEMAPPPMPPVV